MKDDKTTVNNAQKTAPNNGHKEGDLVDKVPIAAESQIHGFSHPEEQLDIPYKGLNPYTEADTGLFFGREHDIQEVVNNLLTWRLTVLFGRSGVGKSSILRAGVTHILNQEARRNRIDYNGAPKLAVVVFPSLEGDLSWKENPLVSLEKQIERTIAQNDWEIKPPKPGLSFTDTLNAWAEALGGEDRDGELYIILDQFEEYFLYHSHDTLEDAFYREFPHAVNCPNLPVNFLISTREDSLAALDRFKSLIPSLLVHRLKIGHLDGEAAEAAIKKPISYYNQQHHTAIKIEQTLVNSILEEVQVGKVLLGESGLGGLMAQPKILAEMKIETPYLQLVMERLWKEEQKRASNVLRLETFKELGRAQQIVKDHLNYQMDLLSEDERRLAASIFQYLVTLSGTKCACSINELATQAGCDKNQLKQLLEKLSRGDQRILRPEGKSKSDQPYTQRYEIFHDALAKPMLEWRRNYLEIQKLEVEKTKLEQQRRRETEKLRIEAERQKFEAEKQRVEAEERQAKAERKWARVLFATAGIALGVVSALSTWIFYQNRELKILRQDVLAGQALVKAETADSLQALQDAMAVGKTVSDHNWSVVVPNATYALQQILGSINETNRWNFTQGIPAPFGFNQSANDQWIVLGLMDGRIYRWKIGQQGWQQVDLRLDDAITSLAISDNGQRIVAANGDGTIKVWDESTRQIKDFSLGETVASFFRVFLSPDGQRLIISTPDGLRMWAIDGKQALDIPWDDPENRIFNISFSPDGQKIAIAGLSSDKKPFIHLLDNQGTELGSLPLSESRPIGILRFSPDGNQLAVVPWGSKNAIVWNVQTQTSVTLSGHWGSISAISFSPDGQQIATGAADGFARVWDLDGAAKWVFKGHDSEVITTGFSRDGKELTTVTSLGTARLWSLERRNCNDADDSCRLLQLPAQGDNNSLWLTDITFSDDPQNTWMATSTYEGTAYLWEVDTSELLKIFKGGSTRNFSTRPKVFLSPDGQQLATIAGDGTARLWSSHNEGSNIKLHTGNADQVALTIDLATDEPKLVTASKDGLLSIKDFKGRVLTTFSVPHFSAQDGRNIFRNAVFSPDGRVIATVSEEDNIPRLWTVRGQPLAELDQYRGQVSDIAFSPDSRTVATAYLDGTVFLTTLHGKTLGAEPIQNGSSVIGVEFSPDGRTLATASFDGRARIWTQQGAKLAEYQSETGLWNTSFMPDGQQIVAVGWGDNNIWLWQVYGLDQLLERGCNWMQPYLETHGNESGSFTVCQDAIAHALQ